MTDFTKLSDSQVEDAINHHRRMRNQSITLNPNAHARHAQMVKDGEAEQAKREAKKQIRAKLKEEVELDEAEKPAYHYYVTHNKGDKNSDWTVTHSKKKPFATARDAADHIMKSGGRRGGTVHTVNAKTGNIVQARSYDSGQAGYPRDPGMGDPRSIRDLKEEVELSELSTEKLRDYAGAALQDKNKAKADKRWKYATKATNTVADRDVKAAHALKYNKMEEVEQIDELSKNTLNSYRSKANDQLDKDFQDARKGKPGLPNRVVSKRVDGVETAYQKLKKEEVELDEVSASTLRSYIDKSRADKKAAMKDRTAASNNMKKYGNMAMDRKDHEDASRRVVNRNTGVSVANQKLNTYPKDAAKAKVMAREEVELDEQTMPGNVALRLVDRHQAAAFHHKKNGNYKGYAVHFKVADRIEDAVIRAGRDMPVKSKQLEAASDKAFKDHPHHPNRSAS